MPFKQPEGCKRYYGIWGCMIFIGISLLIFGLVQRENLQQQHIDAQLSDSIDCVILSVNQGSQCDIQRDGCATDTDTDTGRRRLLRASRGGGGPLCENGWNYKYYYNYEYTVAFKAINICNDQEISYITNYHNQSLITFNYTSSNCIQEQAFHGIGDHICYNVDKQCIDSTFELDEPSWDHSDANIEAIIVLGAIFLSIGGCCCLGWIVWFKYLI